MLKITIVLLQVMILFTVSTQGLYEPPTPVVINQVFIDKGIESSSTYLVKTVVKERTVYLDRPRLFFNHYEVRSFVEDKYNEWRCIYDRMPNSSCVDYALEYQKYALAYGFIISTENEIACGADEGHSHLSAWTQDGKCIYFDVDSIVTRVGAIRGE